MPSTLGSAVILSLALTAGQTLLAQYQQAVEEVEAGYKDCRHAAAAGGIFGHSCIRATQLLFVANQQRRAISVAALSGTQQVLLGELDKTVAQYEELLSKALVLMKAPPEPLSCSVRGSLGGSASVHRLHDRLLLVASPLPAGGMGYQVVDLRPVPLGALPTSGLNLPLGPGAHAAPEVVAEMLRQQGAAAAKALAQKLFPQPP